MAAKRRRTGPCEQTTGEVKTKPASTSTTLQRTGARRYRRRGGSGIVDGGPSSETLRAMAGFGNAGGPLPNGRAAGRMGEGVPSMTGIPSSDPPDWESNSMIRLSLAPPLPKPSCVEVSEGARGFRMVNFCSGTAASSSSEMTMDGSAAGGDLFCTLAKKGDAAAAAAAAGSPGGFAWGTDGSVALSATRP